MSRQHLLIPILSVALNLVNGAGAHAQDGSPDLAVTASFADGRWLRATEAIELRLSQPVPAGTGRVAVVINRTDWTALCEVGPTTLRCQPSAVPFPAGEAPLKVFLVSTGGQWQQVAEFPLRVLRAGGFEELDARPTLEVSSQGQVALGRSPERLPSDRDPYQDLKANLGMLTTLVRRGWTSRSQVNVVGVSNETEALRYQTEGSSAPQMDLAGYLVDLEHRRARFSLGHVQWDEHRHLVSGLATRGVAARINLAPPVDFSFHAANGTSVVGWSNFFGLGQRAHQMVGATLGFEFLPARPGALRVAATYLDGSLLPRAGFTDALVNDAEENEGSGLRLTALDRSERFQLDAGYSRSRFTNPADPLLTRNLAVVPVRETTRAARYLDASYAFLQGRRVGRTQASLTAAFRHSRVDPLYRTVAAQVQADQLQNTFEVTGGIGQFMSQLTWTDGHDNLDGLRSLMTTTTRTAVWTSAVPLASLRREPAAWLPALSYSLNWTHQAGDRLPPNSLFDSLSHVPDQANTKQLVRVEWTGARWRAAYQWNRSFQDNRQPGRQTADFKTLVNTIGVALSPHVRLDLGLEVAFEHADNLEATTADLTRRLGVTGNWRPADRTSVDAVVSATFMQDDPRSRDGRTTDVNLQFSQGIGFLKHRLDWMQGQAFVRFARQTIRSTDTFFQLASRQQFWMVNTGLTFRVF